MDIRCQNKKFAEISGVASGELRVYCPDRFCKQYGNETVEHIFDLARIDKDKVIRPIATNRYKKP